MPVRLKDAFLLSVQSIGILASLTTTIICLLILVSRLPVFTTHLYSYGSFFSSYFLLCACL
jgi:hypothetical protein